MKIRDLIETLEVLEKNNGNVEVYAACGDYPGKVSGVNIRQKGDGYIPTGVAVVHGGL